MDLGLKGKVALVTGATQGIGKATAMLLARAADLERAVQAVVGRWGGLDILVNTVCIGRVKAAQWETRASEQGVTVDKLYEQMGKQVPLGRVGEADEVANVICFLVSAAASYVTGTSVNLDGGMSGVL